MKVLLSLIIVNFFWCRLRCVRSFFEVGVGLKFMMCGVMLVVVLLSILVIGLSLCFLVVFFVERIKVVDLLFMLEVLFVVIVLLVFMKG